MYICVLRERNQEQNLTLHSGQSLANQIDRVDSTVGYPNTVLFHDNDDDDDDDGYAMH